MNIQVWADYHCPYCYLGKRRLEKALETLGVTDYNLSVRSFLLDPQSDSPDGLPLTDHVMKGYDRSREKVMENFRGLEKQGQQLGLLIDMEHAHFAHTQDAHRLHHFASQAGLGNAFFDAAQKALFGEAAILSDPEVLLRIAEQVGLKRQEAAGVLSSDAFHDVLSAQDQEARRMNIDYVPYYIVNGQHHFSGDLSMDDYLTHLNKAITTEGKTQ